MRALATSLLLSAILGAAAAEPAVEVFTLTDGRVLTGTYDEARERLAIAGELRVELAVAPDQIAERVPAAADDRPAPAQAPDPERLERRDRNAIAVSLRQIDARCADLERYRARSEAKADAADAAIDALGEPERAAAAALAACDAGIDEDRRTIDGLKNARALEDERITVVRARVDVDGKPVAVELAQLERELTGIDQRVRELEARLRARDGDRAAVLGRIGGLVAKKRDLTRERDDQRKRAERAVKELAENEAAKQRCERRLAELDAARSAAEAAAASAAGGVAPTEPAAPTVSEP